MNDEAQIRTLIEQWAAAVHSGDLERVLPDHADDIVMFDVPPPENGLRGIQAYRDIWPPFFQWQKTGASFDLVELHIKVGDPIAYAYALLICASKEEREKDPDRRLRLTIGLRKERGRWIVQHEHHSFTDKS
jgi:uncharacterized protein (TIGR02246 family)